MKKWSLLNARMSFPSLQRILEFQLKNGQRQVADAAMYKAARLRITLLLPGTLTPLARTATQNACGADGLNTICFDQPTALLPDAPLGDDDRTGLRVLYPDPADTLHQGSISGRIIPANPLALPAFPPGVTGVFGAHVVAVDNSTGAVMGATLSGWSCGVPGLAKFDGTYQIAGLPVGSSYTVYA